MWLNSPLTSSSHLKAGQEASRHPSEMPGPTRTVHRHSQCLQQSDLQTLPGASGPTLCSPFSSREGELTGETVSLQGSGHTLSCPLIPLTSASWNLVTWVNRVWSGPSGQPFLLQVACHQGREVGFWDVQPREPHHTGLALGDLERGRSGGEVRWEPGAAIKCQGHS